MRHYSVLLNESIDALNIDPNGIYVDATLGRAGHSSVILEKLKDGKLYCFDQDLQAIAESKQKLEAIGGNFEIIHSNFANLKAELNKRGIDKVDGILFDLGVSSPQLDDEERGFSYHGDAKLDMRMDQTQNISAYNIVNEYSEKELANIIYRYGDEKFSFKIASKICEARAKKPIETTSELVDLIKEAIPMKFHFKGKHPARKTFQAIRIEVNKELEVLESSLRQATDLIKKGGVVSVITFHSLEDKIVKKYFKEITEFKKDFNSPLPDIDNSEFKLENKKAIIANDKELEENNRSRSAKLRVISRR